MEVQEETWECRKKYPIFGFIYVLKNNAMYHVKRVSHYNKNRIHVTLNLTNRRMRSCKSKHHEVFLY